MAEEKYDKNDPILVVVKRGRKGRGFIVSPADNDTPYPCMTAEDIGEAIIEMLDDESQPRMTANTVGNQAPPPADEGRKPKEDYASGPRHQGAQTEEQEPQEEEEYEDNPYAEQSATYENMDSVDKAVVNGLSWLLGKARKASDYDHGRGRG